MIPEQGIKSFYPVGSFRNFPPFSRSITENVTIYRWGIESLTHAVFIAVINIRQRSRNKKNNVLMTKTILFFISETLISDMK